LTLLIRSQWGGVASRADAVVAMTEADSGLTFKGDSSDGGFVDCTSFERRLHKLKPIQDFRFEGFMTKSRLMA